MKKTILTSVLAGMFCVCANASDGGIYYTETETFTNHVVSEPTQVVYYEAPRATAPAVRPCPCKARAASSMDVARPCPHSGGNPVRVKSYSEVIDHYQVYQPVVVYQPAGEQVERRIVAQPKPCHRCNGF